MVSYARQKVIRGDNHSGHRPIHLPGGEFHKGIQAYKIALQQLHLPPPYAQRHRAYLCYGRGTGRYCRSKALRASRGGANVYFPQSAARLFNPVPIQMLHFCFLPGSCAHVLYGDFPKSMHRPRHNCKSNKKRAPRSYES